MSFDQALIDAASALLADPLSLLQQQYQFQQQLQTLLGSYQPVDKHNIYPLLEDIYQLATADILATVQNLPGLDGHQQQQVDFYLHRWLEAFTPAHFLFSNPTAIQEAITSQGHSLKKGLVNLQHDMHQGYISTNDTSAFQLGENLAVTPGSVIYQTALMELIQYQPSTATVHRRPLLIIPPWVNKYYILDLKPGNSLIRWLVAQGLTVFVISWVNPDETLANRDFEDYLLEGTLSALAAITAATGETECQMVGYCIGGTLLMCTLAYLAAAGDLQRIKSATCITTLVDFADAGDLGVFIDETQISILEKQMARSGFMEGRQMANIFSLLKTRQMIWPYVVNNYLLGQSPAAFDILYWNEDSTRMPAAMHSFYLRNMYLHNKLRQPGGIELAGESLDLSQIKVPLYFFATEQDHIAPWKSCYKGALLSSGPKQFVLGESGHVAGVINPPDKKKYGYWRNNQLSQNPEDWLADAKFHRGSWWPDWLRWLKRRSGKTVAAKPVGSDDLPTLMNAPGSYVKVRYPVKSA